MSENSFFFLSLSLHAHTRWLANENVFSNLHQQITNALCIQLEFSLLLVKSSAKNVSLQDNKSNYISYYRCSEIGSAMTDEERFAFENNLFQQVDKFDMKMSTSSHPQFQTHSSTVNEQDEIVARRKLEQKRRFQQKQANPTTDVDSLMKSMFSDLKLQTKTNLNHHSSG